MSFWKRLRKAFGLDKSTAKVRFEVEEQLIQTLQYLAKREDRPEDALASDLLSYALARHEAAEAYRKNWQALSPREEQVAALICLGYTNRQIAERLVISMDTVKTHVRHVLRKFEMSSKAEMRHAMVDWDFSAWKDADL
jgi:DNA-binding NarL/FixJ family response regulator